MLIWNVCKRINTSDLIHTCILDVKLGEGEVDELFRFYQDIPHTPSSICRSLFHLGTATVRCKGSRHPTAGISSTTPTPYTETRMS